MPAPPHSRTIAQLENLIRRDPAQRGLIGTEREFGPLCPGHLAAAATDLVQHGRSVAVVTGVYSPRGQPPAAEPEGPLGALFLAQILHQLGIDAFLITDNRCHHALSVAAHAMDFSAERVLQTVIKDDADCETFFQSARAATLTHVIAIERVGPSHTSGSLRVQSREGPVPVEEFRQQVPLAARNHCHNMRGEIIDEFSGNLHRLFEFAAARPGIKSIGIGDGANEIGMGSIPWENLRQRLDGDHAGRIPCRIATDWTIIAGTSNWGGYALATAVALLKDAVHVLAPYDAAQQFDVLSQMVAQGPAVDGVTLKQEATVDGLPFATYIQPLDGMRQLLRID